VFPIWGKVLKAGFRYLRKNDGKTRVFSGFEKSDFVCDKSSISFWNCYCSSMRSLFVNY